MDNLVAFLKTIDVKSLMDIFDIQIAIAVILIFCDALFSLILNKYVSPLLVTSVLSLFTVTFTSERTKLSTTETFASYCFAS